MITPVLLLTRPMLLVPAKYCTVSTTFESATWACTPILAGAVKVSPLVGYQNLTVNGMVDWAWATWPLINKRFAHMSTLENRGNVRAALIWFFLICITPFYAL